MRNIWLPILLLIALIVVGTWLWITQCCGVVGASTAGAASAATTAAVTATTPAATASKINPLLIRDKTLIASSDDNFTFPQDGFRPNIPGATENAFSKLATYLKDNPSRLLTVTGLYAASEKYQGQFPTLGIARADAIKNKLVALGADGNQIKLADKLEGNLNFPDKLLYDGVTFGFAGKPAPAAAPSARLAIADANKFKTNAPDNLSFKKSSFEFEKPIPAPVNKSYGELVTYLKNNPERQLTVTGLYHTDEKNSSIYPTLGLARANNVKSQLVRMGAKTTQILAKDRKLGTLNFVNDMMKGGINYSFNAMPVVDKGADDKRLKDLEKLVVKPIILNFETNASNLNLTTAQQNKFAQMIEYIEKVPTAKIQTTGHTDDVGDAANNKRLGQGRADFAKNYLVRNGVNGKKIRTNSEGEVKPIASNKTEDGRAKNRRVEVRVVK